MTTFITASFKVDLSNLNITFSEENSFFERNLIKQHSFPFKIPRERSYIPFFEFISSHNSTESNRYVKGTLFRNDKYYEAELLVLNISKQIEAIIYYSFEKVSIFDKKLNTLPFPNIIVGDNIYAFAKETIAKNYPATKVNFVQIYDPEKYKDYDYGVYKGYINYNEDNYFREVPYFSLKPNYMNEIRPFVYLKEVMKFIFSEINYTIIGDFMTDNSINQCLLYNDKSIFYTNKDYTKTEDTLSLNLTERRTIISNGIKYFNTYSQYIYFNSYGTYSFKLNIEWNSPYNQEYVIVKVSFNGWTYSKTNIQDEMGDFKQTHSFDFTVGKTTINKPLAIEIICSSEVKITVKGNFEITGTSRPLYLNSFSLKDIIPDTTVGEFINNVKETFNMSSVFNNSTKTVELNFFNTAVKNTPMIDLSSYGIDSVPRKLNKSTGYKIPFSNEEIININKKGEAVSSEIGFAEKKIPIEPLPIVTIENKLSVKHQEGLSILFFESNPNANALTRDAQASSFRLDFIKKYLLKWYYQNLNSEEYNLTINLPLFVSVKLSAESKIWIYNSYFLVRNLKRVNVNNLFEKVTLNLFKLKSLPKFTGFATFLPPVAFTSESRISTVLKTEFNSGFRSSNRSKDFLVVIYANNSTDPQKLSLSYNWELISRPFLLGSGIFIFYPDDDKSVAIFQYITEGRRIAGIYIVRLTVTNSEGLSNFIDITVRVT